MQTEDEPTKPPVAEPDAAPAIAEVVTDPSGPTAEPAPKPPATDTDVLVESVPTGLEGPPPTGVQDVGTEHATPRLIFQAQQRLELDIADAIAGKPPNQGAPKDRLTELCRVIDYWLDDDTGILIENMGLISLAEEIKSDYVTASFLAWRGEFKIAYITLRSFLESFCLLLYYLNQGCDRLLFLRGKGYKLMLHRMAQKKSVPDEMHAFRRHYHLLIEDAYGSAKAADKFFDEIDACYGTLSKAVHGDYATSAVASSTEVYLDTLTRVLRICNTLALHEPILDVTDDLLETALGGVLKPISFEWKPR